MTTNICKLINETIAWLNWYVIRPENGLGLTLQLLGLAQGCNMR